MQQGRLLEGRVAIVTGAGRGIGRAEALLFAKHGAKVVVNDLGGKPTGGGHDPSLADGVVEEIRSLGGTAVADSSSIDSFSAGAKLIETAIDAFGRIDLLSNNAGIVRPHVIDEMTEEDFDSVVAVNLRGYFGTVRHAAPHFKKQGSGVIINKSSPSGFGHYGMANYSAAKEGVAGFTRSIARDLGPFGIRANIVRPVAYQSTMAIPEVSRLSKYSREHLGGVGIWNRPMSPVKGVVPAPEHVAALTVWLTTDNARHINGQDLFISGTEIGILQEPELIRACFDPDGWTLEALDDPNIRQYLTGHVRNYFAPKPS